MSLRSSFGRPDDCRSPRHTRAVPSTTTSPAAVGDAAGLLALVASAFAITMAVFPGLRAGGALSWLVLSAIASFVAAAVALGSRHRPASPAVADIHWIDRSPLCDAWNDVREQIREGRPGSTEALLALLGSLRAGAIERYRLACLLDMVGDEEQTSDELLARMQERTSPREAEASLALAGRLGCLELRAGLLRTSERGRRELAAATRDGYRRDTWRFIEVVLGDAILVACPRCHTANLRRWTNQHDQCPGCGGIVDLAATSVVPSSPARPRRSRVKRLLSGAAAA
jgi:hypothetical protein